MTGRSGWRAGRVNGSEDRTEKIEQIGVLFEERNTGRRIPFEQAMCVR